jgi:proteasome assembly chaperone (PAC2) family protein
MVDALDLWKKPKAKEMYMLAGWRQWADGGSVSSGLPEYLVQLMAAEPIGKIRPDGFYLFQVPGTHDLVRPVVRFEEGYPKALETQHNDFYYFGDDRKGFVIFLGDEPHLDVERYVGALLAAAKELGVMRIIGLGGVYGELPYDKERMVSSNYSLMRLKQEVSRLAVGLSDYQGGASIGSFVCRRAGDLGMEYIGLYALVPAYDLSVVAHFGSSIRLENDYMAWLGVMRRIDYMFKLNLDLTDLEKKSKHLVGMMDAKVDEIEREMPQANLRERIQKISAEFKETPFIPLDDQIEDELRRLLDKFSSKDET